jgi:hypothetical protein
VNYQGKKSWKTGMESEKEMLAELYCIFCASLQVEKHYVPGLKAHQLPAAVLKACGCMHQRKRTSKDTLFVWFRSKCAPSDTDTCAYRLSFQGSNKRRLEHESFRACIAFGCESREILHWTQKKKERGDSHLLVIHVWLCLLQARKLPVGST